MKKIKKIFETKKLKRKPKKAVEAYYLINDIARFYSKNITLETSVIILDLAKQLPIELAVILLNLAYMVSDKKFYSIVKTGNKKQLQKLASAAERYVPLLYTQEFMWIKSCAITCRELYACS